jgi:hypothetical protein
MYSNIYTPVQHLRRPPVNPGGLCWLVFALHEDVLQWPQIDPQSNLAATSIQLKPAKTWYECNVINKEKMFTEQMRVEAAGHYWEMQVQGYIGGNNSNMTLAANTMAYHHYVVMLKDRDGQIRFIGSRDRGADFLPDYTSGDSEQGRRWNIKFGWQHINTAPIYVGSLNDIMNDVIIPPFVGAGNFNDDFNEDFDI